MKWKMPFTKSTTDWFQFQRRDLEPVASAGDLQEFNPNPHASGEGFAMVEWIATRGVVDYSSAVLQMEQRVDDIAAGRAGEAVWLLEHPPIYTAGIRALDSDISPDPPFPVHRTGRGGQVTYHGPGQRVAYVMVDLKARDLGVHGFVRLLEAWTIRALDRLGVNAFVREGRTGVWVNLDSPSGTKIAAIGIRLRRWVSFHGVSINVAPNLVHYDAIVPCGITEYGVTSLAELAVEAGIGDLDMALRRAFQEVFS